MGESLIADRYMVKHQIGRGSFGEIFLGMSSCFDQRCPPPSLTFFRYAGSGVDIITAENVAIKVVGVVNLLYPYALQT